MKFLSLIFAVCLQWLGSQLLCAQCQTVSQLHFPYEKGLEMELRGNTVEYDEFNFPLKTKEYVMHYSVTENTAGGKGNTALFDIDIVVDKDTVSKNNLSHLYLNAKGMSWKSAQDKEKLTQAILLPLEKGKTWYTSFGNQKNKMTCITVDSSMTLYLGEVKTFGVQYELVDNSNPRFVVHQDMAEYYNQYLGKVAVTVRQYGIERTTGRKFVFYTEDVLLSYTNIPQERIKLALQACR